MGSSRGQDRSLGSGLSLPQWMKGRMDSRYDFDQNSFSPPSHDDSFFYIRYPRTSETTSANSGSGNQGTGYRPISQVLNEKTINTSGAVAGQVGSETVARTNISQSGSSSTISSNIKEVKTIDYSKHPLPCQPFITGAGGKELRSAAEALSNKKPTKSRGIDDGFHGEAALCGKSIVHVANRIMSQKFTKGETDADKDTKQTMEKPDFENSFRKGSRSLPVTPITSPTSTPDTSPKSRRKMHSNRYFTGAFVHDRDKYQTGWILSSILGQSREVMNKKIQEEDEDAPTYDAVPSKFLNRKKSISSQNLSYIGKSETLGFLSGTESALLKTHEDQQSTSKQTTATVLQAKPSELREMNFWSPTSM